MKIAEMNARLETMPSALRDRVIRLIREGYGGSGIKHETDATLKQINACFEFVHLEKKMRLIESEAAQRAA